MRMQLRRYLIYSLISFFFLLLFLIQSRKESPFPASSMPENHILLEPSEPSISKGSKPSTGDVSISIVEENALQTQFLKEMYQWENASDNNPRLIKLIKEEFLVSPTPRDRPYTNLIHPNVVDPSQQKQTKYILNLLQKKTNGFFIECGALDGEDLSNSIYMERSLNWTGLLIEGAQKFFKEMTGKNRKAWLSNACLSLTPHPTKVIFKESGFLGGIEVSKGEPSEVQCLPLYSLLLAVNQTEVDYFSLDVEGSEFKILQTIPWEKVKIKTLSVEISHRRSEGMKLINYMKSKGYVVLETNHITEDVILYHPGHLGRWRT